VRKLAVLCPSEIALRRFMPALRATGIFAFAGIGTASPEEWFGDSAPSVSAEALREQRRREREKAECFTSQFGGEIYPSYSELLASPEVEAVYIPLPPGLHFRWAKAALAAGKHVFVEKPAATSAADAAELAALADSAALALHENYMFVFHRQLEAIDGIIASGEIGEVRLYRISFGFPRRAAGDFRYSRKLGGGALFDCGGYTIRYATRLLGESARLVAAQSGGVAGFEVDMYGSAMMVNADGAAAQIAFGMDNDYKCELEVWGSRGCLVTGRVLTAPAGFVPTVEIRRGGAAERRELPADDAFGKSIARFRDCIGDPAVRRAQYAAIVKQAEMVDEFRRLAGMNR